MWGFGGMPRRQRRLALPKRTSNPSPCARRFPPSAVRPAPCRSPSRPRLPSPQIQALGPAVPSTSRRWRPCDRPARRCGKAARPCGRRGAVTRCRLPAVTPDRPGCKPTGLPHRAPDRRGPRPTAGDFAALPRRPRVAPSSCHRRLATVVFTVAAASTALARRPRPSAGAGRPPTPLRATLLFREPLGTAPSPNRAGRPRNLEEPLVTAHARPSATVGGIVPGNDPRQCGWQRRARTSAPMLIDVWQGRWDSNSQPPVLETGALPIELRPFNGRRGGSRVGRRPTLCRQRAAASHREAATRATRLPTLLQNLRDDA